MSGKNKTGGNKARRGGKRTRAPRKLDDVIKSSARGEVYGKVISALGDRHFKVVCQTKEDNKVLHVMTCKLPKQHRDRLEVGQYALVQHASYNDKQAYIIVGLKEGEVNSLKKAKLWDFPEDKVDKDEYRHLPQEHAFPEKDRAEEDGEDSDSETDSDSAEDSDEGPRRPRATVADRAQEMAKASQGQAPAPAQAQASEAQPQPSTTDDFDIDAI